VGYPIFYYQDGAGPCNASAVAAPAPAPEPVTEPHARSFGAWMRSLNGNPVLIAAWVVTIPSGAQRSAAPAGSSPSRADAAAPAGSDGSAASCDATCCRANSVHICVGVVKERKSLFNCF
jgi:hypothetical protein